MGYTFDAHEVSVMSTVGGCFILINRTMHKGWIRALIHRHPIVAISVAWGCVGVTMPIWVVPIRRQLGYPTNHYDAAHPDCVFPKYD